MSKRAFSIIILAAGKGSRMISNLPKVLHPLAGKAMVQHVIDTAICLKPKQIHLVYGYCRELLYQHLSHQKVTINWVLQNEQLGTGHAVQQTISNLRNNEDILILYGDVPLISVDTLLKLLHSRPKNGIALLTVTLKNPYGYGRIIRIKNNISGIIEHKDASIEQLKIKEINTGILVASGNDLKRWLTKLTKNYLQNEIYLTDIIKIAWNEGKQIDAVQPVQPSKEVEGINNQLQLSKLERYYQRKQAKQLLLSGVMLMDPERFDLRGKLYHGKDVSIDINVILEGKIILGNRVIIGAFCVLKNVIIGDDVVISPYTIIKDAQLATRSTVGPFSHLRPGSKLDDGAHVGNFVEIKKTNLGKHSKVSHLSYLGDADIGTKVNIGAGTITCNYDGINKHKTIINDNVLIGADSQLIAPINIGADSTIGAGTTVTNNVAAGETIISRIRQFSIKKLTKSLKNN